MRGLQHSSPGTALRPGPGERGRSRPWKGASRLDAGQACTWVVGWGFFCSQDSVLFLPAYRPHPKSRLEPLKEARSCISRISYSIPVRFSKPYGEGFTDTDTDTDTDSASLLAPNLHTHTHTRPPSLYILPQRNRPAPGADLELSLYRLEVWAFAQYSIMTILFFKHNRNTDKLQ